MLLGQFIEPVPTEAVAWLGMAVAGILLAGAPFAPRWLGPVGCDLRTLHFFVRGPFGTRMVLASSARRRTVAAGGIGVVLAVCLSLATGAPPVATACSGAAGLAAGVLVALAILASRSAAQRTVRLASAGIGACALGGGIAGSVFEWATQALIPVAFVALAAGVVGILFVGRLVEGVSAATLEVDAERRATSAAGVVVGDIKAVFPPPSPSRFRRRGRPLDFSTGLARRIVRRDLRGIERLPAPAILSCVVVALASALMVVERQPAEIFFCGLVAQVAVGPLMAGLRNHVEHIGLDALDRGGFAQKWLAHLMVPAALALLAACLGGGVAAGVLGAPAATAFIGAGITLVALAARAWTANSGAAPLWVSTPVPTPAGDVSSAVFIGWVCRSALPVAIVSLAMPPVGLPVALLAGLLVAVLLAMLSLRRLCA
ncbi:hypothetical protein AX769_01125 [Frondihabitans sp. PAMC 28766]|nr:hypothetical protein AX769_01125 [Frondihabitans sp. PAMC 28766]